MQSFYESNITLLAETPALDLYDPEWVVHTKSEERPAAQLVAKSAIERSLLCDGCRIDGRRASGGRTADYHRLRKGRWMFGKYPLTLRFFVFVAVPLLGCGIAAWTHFRASLPVRDAGPVAVGVAAPVTLSRDGHGVAFIRAASDRDAFFALGYAHAQDRLWQLELQRRIAQGRLAEIFGRHALNQDVWMRTLGLYGAAASSWEALDAPARESLSDESPLWVAQALVGYPA